MNYTIEKAERCEYEIKKSRFIANIMPITDLDDCKQKLQKIKKEYYDATHNCYSYVILENNQLTIKNSDDGEPSKTAGVVIYDVLKKNDLVNVLCVITRYFGGIKLGANGLVRAYSKATSDVVNIIKKIKIENMTSFSFIVSYQYVNDCMKLFENYKEENKEFSDKAKFTYLIPENNKNELIDELVKITKNNIELL
ncbi:MAG: YigZ family protein [Bacilli bacterium]|nr:YigZ family protein [Bacilli bacterium]